MNFTRTPGCDCLGILFMTDQRPQLELCSRCSGRPPARNRLRGREHRIGNGIAWHLGSRSRFCWFHDDLVPIHAKQCFAPTMRLRLSNFGPVRANRQPRWNPTLRGLTPNRKLSIPLGPWTSTYQNPFEFANLDIALSPLPSLSCLFPLSIPLYAITGRFLF